MCASALLCSALQAFCALLDAIDAEDSAAGDGGQGFMDALEDPGNSLTIFAPTQQVPLLLPDAARGAERDATGGGNTSLAIRAAAAADALCAAAQVGSARTPECRPLRRERDAGARYCSSRARMRLCVCRSADIARRRTERTTDRC
jgi:hypothetical protein